jgi:hypothetical protein
MPASGRHPHKGHRGKRQKLSLHTCFEFHPGFSSQRCDQITVDSQSLKLINYFVRKRNFVLIVGAPSELNSE